MGPPKLILNSFQVKSNDQHLQELQSEYLPQSITDEELEQYESYCAYMFRSIKQFKNHPETNLNNFLNFFDYINQLFCKSKLYQMKDNLYTRLDPSVGFQQLINKQNGSKKILINLTIHPFDSWPEELNIQFKVHPLENGNLDGIANNVKGYVLKEFNFSYQHRNDDRQIINLGNLIIQYYDVVPGGMLVVFSSYQIMNMIKVAWNNYQMEFINAKKKGAILFCVQEARFQRGSTSLMNYVGQCFQQEFLFSLLTNQK